MIRTILHFFRLIIFSYLWVFIYGLALGVLILGSLGIIDKNGALERKANAIISNSIGLPIEELEKLEGVKLDDQSKERKTNNKR